ncbi:MAG: M13 family metallopeptidase [Thermoanaerobaculia bacterium]
MRFAATAVLVFVLMGGGIVAPVGAAGFTNERGLDRRNMDPSADPCEDFYQFANGNWLKNNPIPDEYSIWSISNEVRERNFALLKEILEEAAADENALKGSNRQKIGDFYATAMDLEMIEKRGAGPLAGDLERIAKAESLDDIRAIIRDFHAEGISVLFEGAVFQDLKNSEMYIMYAVQGGLGLPDRDYYTRTDEESVELKKKYVAHVSKMLQLLGDSAEEADQAAEAILALETRLAEASLTNVELRNPENYYNIETIEAADAATPNFSWARYLQALGLEELETFSFAHPKFFAEMNTALEDLPLATWKNYLRWNLASGFAPYLSSEFVEEDFAFNQATLQGTEEMKPRWKRVLNVINGNMGEALGQLYVEKAFPPQAKASALEMIGNLQAAVKERIEKLDWMGDETRAKALEKLAAFNAKIGYPDEWRDYTALEIGRTSYADNVRAAVTFEMRRNLDKIGEPIDRNEWAMAPQAVNAYYMPVMNEIVFPAGILQPPYFDFEIDSAVNYGGMGAVIGHEFMHGFDDQGSRFDADGNMINWWTDQDTENFKQATEILVDQYNGFVAIDDLHVNGELTLGENIGDFSGLTMSFYGLQKALAEDPVDKIDDFTPEQRFFLAWAQAWRRNYRPEALKLQVNTDPHSPGKFRVLGPLSNMPEFYEAFGCDEGDAMFRPTEERVVIW